MIFSFALTANLSMIGSNARILSSASGFFRHVSGLLLVRTHSSVVNVGDLNLERFGW